MKLIIPALRGLLNYFRIENLGKTFNNMNNGLIKEMCRHLIRSAGRKGYG
ncbi:hypothetical protein [Chitinophaga sancti]